MSVDLSKFKAAFFEESAEHIATMEEGLLQLEQHPGDTDLLNRIFRAAHSIKGNAGMFGLTAVAEFTHTLENILDALRNGHRQTDQALIDLLLEATDGVKGLLEAAQTDTVPDDRIVAPLQARLASVLDQTSRSTTLPVATKPKPDPPAPTGGTLYKIQWSPALSIFQRGVNLEGMLLALRKMGALTAIGIDLERIPSVDALATATEPPTWELSLRTDGGKSDIEEVFEFVQGEGELTITEMPPEHPPRPAEPGHEVSPRTRDPLDGPQPLGEILVEDGVVGAETLHEALAQQKRLGQVLVEQHAATPTQVAEALEKQRRQIATAKKNEAATIRVDTEKIDKLINLVGELIITQSMLSDLGARFDMSQRPIMLERIAQLERNTREIQERVMSVRMLPISTAFNRFPRLVRDLAAKNGKLIHLVLSGEDTELDKTVIESIGDPLTHLVRNSADHGLEPPDERIGAGKPAQGTITLNAFHEGGNICITVGDDGRGLNRDKILAKAIKHGLITETDKAGWTDEQIWPLIFRPGFSTAEVITDVSGRGVGMDVVKRNIEALGGTVSIATTAGRGTTFILKLPLTLAIIEGMTIRVGTETYIVPLTSIIESVRPKPDMVKTILERGEVVNVRGEYVPVIRLYELFGIPPDCTEPTEAILVIMETELHRVAIMVDELLGQQQVVIKSLEQNFQKVGGIAGATILGNGTVAFILDLRGLIQLTHSLVPVGR